MEKRVMMLTKRENKPIWRVFWVVLLSLPWLMGQNTCSVRSPLASKTKTYGQNAKELYTNGRKMLKNGNFQDARRAFHRIKTKYPFSAYAILADVAIGDTYFKAGKFLRAIDIFKLFYRLHPTHRLAGYAAYKVGESYDKLRPFDWFLVPPSYHKDSTYVRQSIRAFRRFIRRFPKHRLVPKARKKMLFALNLLAKHDMLVARFYRKKGKHRAVVWRMEHLLKKYPGVKLEKKARFFRAEALVALKRYDEASNAFGEIVKLYPQTSFARSAKVQVTKLKSLVKAMDSKKSKKKKSLVQQPLVQKPAVPRPTSRKVK